MNKKNACLVLILTCGASLLTACGPATAGLMQPTETRIIEETQLVENTPEPEALATQDPAAAEPPLPEDTPAAPELVPGTPTETATVTVMPTPQAPLAEVTNTPASAEEAAVTVTEPATGTGCIGLELVEEATFPSSEDVTAGAALEKIWRVRNSGTCGMIQGFTLEFLNGEMMEAAPGVVPFVDVQPGETVDLRLLFVAPDAPGTHSGNWMVRLVDGSLIGLGGSGQAPLRLEITVEASTQVAYDFSSDICAATWSSQTTYGLECPTSGLPGTGGWVGIDLQPVLEDGRIENEPAVIMVPSDGSGGYISGFYPAIHIETGDVFSAVIGCLKGFDTCNVVFQLNYYTLTDPTTRQLGSWNETYNQDITHIDVSLSTLAGQDVLFQLLVLSNGESANDRAFWLSPRLMR